MTNGSPPSLGDLRRRRQNALEKAEEAVIRSPAEYRQLKRLLGQILAGPVDVGDYYRVARQLGRLLETLTASCPESLFAYFYHNIDPDKQGDARYFKIMCLDLKKQVDLLERYRRQHRGLRVVE